MGDCTLKELIDKQHFELMFPGVAVQLKDEVNTIQEPSYVLKSVVKVILESVFDLHMKKRRAFRGNLEDLNCYGLYGIRDGNYLDKVNRVFLLNQNLDRGKDLESELRMDRERVVRVIKNLVSVDEKNSLIPFEWRQFHRLLDAYVMHTSEDKMLELINHYALSEWHTKLFKVASLSALFKTDKCLKYSSWLPWIEAVPNRGIMRKFLKKHYENQSSHFVRYIRNLFSHSLELYHYNMRLPVDSDVGSSSTVDHHHSLQLQLMEVFKEDLEYLIKFRI